MSKTTSEQGFTLTGIKQFASPDGGGMNAMLRWDGRIIGTVHDGGHGGGFEVHVSSKTDREAFHAFLKEWWANGGKAEHEKEMAEFEAEMRADRAARGLEPLTLPKVSEEKQAERDNNGYWIEQNWLSVQETAWGKEQEAKRLARMAERKTLFRRKGATYKDGEWHTINEPYNEKVRAWLDKKYGADLTEIYGVLGPTANKPAAVTL